MFKVLPHFQWLTEAYVSIKLGVTTNLYVFMSLFYYEEFERAIQWKMPNKNLGQPVNGYKKGFFLFHFILFDEALKYWYKMDVPNARMWICFVFTFDLMSLIVVTHYIVS